MRRKCTVKFKLFWQNKKFFADRFCKFSSSSSSFGVVSPQQRFVFEILTNRGIACRSKSSVVLKNVNICSRRLLAQFTANCRKNRTNQPKCLTIVRNYSTKVCELCEIKQRSLKNQILKRLLAKNNYFSRHLRPARPFHVFLYEKVPLNV